MSAPLLAGGRAVLNSQPHRVFRLLWRCVAKPVKSHANGR